MRVGAAGSILFALCFLVGDTPVESRGFRQTSISTGKGPRWISVADVNHDGLPDIVTTNLDDDTVSILLGDGRGGFRNAPG